MYFQSTTDIFIISMLIFIMMSVGMSLTVKDFSQVLKSPRVFILGLVLQMIVVPAISFGVAEISGLSDEWKVGFIILAVCPGGPSASFINYLFRANIALSIALTSINSFLALITIPLVTNLALGVFMHSQAHIQLPFWETVSEIFLITLIPAGVGVTIRYFMSNFAEKIQTPLKYLSMILLGVVFYIKIFANKSSGGSGLSLENIIQLLPVTLILNALGLFLGYFITIWNKYTKEDGLTIGLEMAIHNTSLAFLIANTLLHNDEMMKPALVYAMFSFWTALVFGVAIMGNPFGKKKAE
jgi:BASS family bile acid:Na+ symporter